MAPFFIVVGILAVIGLIVWGAIVAYRKEQARIAALGQLALSKGWQFSAGDPYNLPHRWHGDPFGNGYDQEATNVITGMAGERQMLSFDYSYKEDSTDSKGNTTTTTYHYAVCAVALPCGLPELSITPEGFFSKIGHALGMDDIELESEDFNRRFKVRCSDRKLAMDVLSPRTMELLLATGKVHLRFEAGDLLTWDGGHQQPADVLNRAGLLHAVLDGVPGFVWKDRSA